MKKTIYLPSKTKNKLDTVERIVISDYLIIGSTTGLKKKNNEDSIGCFTNKGIIRICIADGHWGEKASRLITRHWLNSELEFPSNSFESKQETKKTENKLYKKFGKPAMNGNKDFTPEASFVAVEISNGNISIVSYGDSRLLIANNGKLKFKQKCSNTWLGAFSHLGLRKRISVEKATFFRRNKLAENDCVFLFTDGIDQCVYEKDTISFEKIAMLSKTNIKDTFDELFKEVFDYGAEDNASLAVFKY